MAYIFKFPQTRQSLIDAKRFWITAVALIIGSCVLAVNAYGQTSDPMEDKQSKEIRAEFAKCRDLVSPLSQFFCSCQVLEKQCLAPRKLEHGNWTTVEYWPSDDEDEREVQFVLFLEYNLLGDFDVWGSGVVMTCMQGQSDINVFLGYQVDSTIPAQAMIDDASFVTKFDLEENDVVLTFENANKVYKALDESEIMTVTYNDLEDGEQTVEFETSGFEAATKGWEKLCTSPTS